MKNTAGILFFFFFLLLHPVFSQISDTARVALPAKTDSGKASLYDKFTNIFKNKSYVIAPELGRKPETGLSGGIYWLQVFRISPNADSATRKSNTESYVDYTEKKQLLAQVKNNLIFKDERFFLKGTNFYNKFPDLYWGVGPNTTQAMQQSVSYDLISIDQRLLTRVGSRYFVGLIYQYVNLSNVTYSPGGPLDVLKVSGYQGSVTSGAGFDFLYDSRDNILNTYKGLLVEFSSVFNQKSLGGDHYFNNYTLDIRDFINFGGRHVLGLQGMVDYNTGDVPWRQMSCIGGDMLMRGYYYGRYRDKLMIAAQAEYRFPVWRAIGLTAFVSAAEVEPTFSQLYWPDMKYVAGLCLRIMINKAERLNMGIDSGIGPGTSGLYFNSGEAF